MSNRTEPQLNTVLPEMPKINLLEQHNIISTHYDSFPPMKTPVLQPLHKETISYPAFRNKPINNSIIIKKEKEIKPSIVDIIFKYIVILIAIILIYNILVYIKKIYF
jgi:hypothetical protein